MIHLSKHLLFFSRINCVYKLNHNGPTNKSMIDKYFYDSFNNLAEPENRLAFLADPLVLNNNYIWHLKQGTSSIFKVDENMSPVFHRFVMHIALKDIITKKASQLLESGSLSYSITFPLRKSIKFKPEEIGPQILTLKNLEAGFIIILMCLAVSIVAFVAECTPKLMRKLKTQIEICVACFVVVKFVKMKKMF
jgi:hypothetical protein